VPSKPLRVAAISGRCGRGRPRGVEIALRETVYDGDPADIKGGVRVTVWYRSVGERRPVADIVRVLGDPRPATASPLACVNDPG
jgi:hypothetical protein